MCVNEDKAFQCCALHAEARSMLNILKEFAPLYDNGMVDHLWSALQSHGERHYAQALTDISNEMRAIIAKVEEKI